MDGECSDSDLLPKKLQGHDRIGELPEEIIVSILSFLSVKEAAATSLLSPQWRNLWKQTPKLIFISEIPNLNSSSNDVQEQDSSWDAERCEYVKTVNSVLRSHKALVLRWFVASFYVNKSAQPHVVKWLELLSSRRVKRLMMDFQCWDEKDMLVLEELLRESRLFEAPRTDHDHVMLFKSLRKLSLEHLKVRGEDIELFLRNCPSLKKLIICYAVFTSDVEICSLKLKRLGIYGCSGGISVKVSAPKLNWIVYNDRLKELSLENVPKLAKAHFSIRSTKFALQHFGSAASCCISQLKILSLTLNHPRVNVVNKFVEMPKLKKLTVTYFGVHNQTLLPLTPLLWASPRLEEFELRFIRSLAEGAIVDEMEVSSNAEKRSHEKLKVFEFRGYCSGISDQIVELVAYISDNCAKFREIIIDGPIPGTVIVHGDPPHRLSEIEADETESDHRDYLKEQLREKVPNHIQMQFY